MNWYKNYALETVETPANWENPSSEQVNLLLGVPVYGISTDSELDEEYHTEYYNTRESSALLTDGERCETPVFTDRAFFHITRGVGRTIVFRLPAMSALSSVRIGFLREDGVGVALPRRCDIYLSPDGANFQRVFHARGLSCADSPMRYEWTAEFDQSYRALYLLCEIEAACHVWMDEIEAFGTQSLAGAADITPEPRETAAPARFVNRYPDYSDFCGVHNMLLAYNCVPPDEKDCAYTGRISEEDFLPHLAYLDEAGKMKDTLFDSFLFLPYSVYTYSSLYKCASGWRYYVDNLFDKDCNLPALERAAARVGETLGIPDYRVKVFFSIFHTKVGYGDHPDSFGDLDGDGVEEDMATLADRKKAVQWIIDEQLKRYAAMNSRYTECKGFYWFEERINYSDACELELIAFAREYLHERGYLLFWIPYFQGCGFQDWKENGFDLACMQPNYGVRKNAPKSRLYATADIAKKFGMCVEMEISDLDPDTMERFRCYLDAGAETGYMNTVKIYYQNGVPGMFYHACHAADPLTRSLYDDLYLFAKERYCSRNR